MQDETYRWFRTISSWTLVVVGGIGIPVNLFAFWLLWKKQSLSNFHILLIILSLSDLVVVIGCVMIYGLSDVWPTFNIYSYTAIAPWLIPVVQIALLTSVYATVLLSFERYVRVIFTCNLKHFKYFNEDNFKYYMAALLVIPTIFYLPKFFEYESVTTTKSFRYSDPCDDGNLTDCVYDPDYENGTTLVRHKYTEYNFTELKFSSLRENYYYRRIYHMGLNSIMTTLIPLCTLVFLNTKICLAIRKKTERDKQEFQTLKIANIYFKIKRSRSFEVHERKGDSSRTFQFTPKRVAMLTGGNNDTLEHGIEMDEVDLVGAKELVQIENDTESVNQIRISPPRVPRSQSLQRSPNPQLTCYSKRFFYKNEKTLTRISIFIVWLFLGCHVWKIVPNVYEVFHMDESNGQWPLWLDYFCLISHLVIVANSSFNFLMYLIF